MNCESVTGYLFGFIIYAGAETKYGDARVMKLPFDEYITPSKVLISLMRIYANKGYTVTLDNRYTSPEVAEALFKRSIDSYDTLRKKAGLPIGLLVMSTGERGRTHHQV